MLVCYQGWPSADAHDTVRHEAFHLIQSCHASNRGQVGLRSILTGKALDNFVRGKLPDDEIISIKSFYPRLMWLAELEAHAAANHYSAAQLIKIINRTCS